MIEVWGRLTNHLNTWLDMTRYRYTDSRGKLHLRHGFQSEEMEEFDKGLSKVESIVASTEILNFINPYRKSILEQVSSIYDELLAGPRPPASDEEDEAVQGYRAFVKKLE